jgi:two-component system phosphate regulon sensor histidine kinase PhoR
MKQVKWLFHPILVFVFSVTALVASLFLYNYWYIGVSSGLRSAMERFNLEQEQVFAADTWVVILVLSLLIGTILLGIFIIFVFSQKTMQLYRMQNNFINNFTHELKTPVTSLQLYLQTFSRYELSRDDQLKYIGYMLTDVNRLTDNINRMLNLAKLESKSYMGEFVVCDIVKTVNQFLEENAHLFNGSRITVHPPQAGIVYQRINRHLFEMLLLNLLTNAIKYNAAERPQVEIFIEPKHRKTHIRFADNGIGFDRKEMKKIFRKFYQVGRSDDMTAKGSGLGLHLVQNIARLHKGKVLAESPGRGRGSTFTLILPALE